MNLDSEIGHELAPGETNGIGMRVVDVGEKGEFTHKWTLLDDEEELYVKALRRILKSSTVNPLPESTMWQELEGGMRCEATKYPII